MSEIKDWKEYNEALLASYKASETELNAICENIDKYLKTIPDIEVLSDISDMSEDEKYIKLYTNDEFLRVLQFSNLPISVLQTILNNTTNIMEFSIRYIDFSNHDNWRLEYDYNVKYVLVHKYGRIMRKMYEADIEIIDYVLKVLTLLDLKESDIDWEYILKNGMED
jgi:hypothetical protein